MKSTRQHDSSQLELDIFCPVKVTNLGDGTFKFELGKPLQWLNPKQFAAEMGVDRDSVYRWIQEGTLPHKIALEDKTERVLVERRGKWCWRIYPAAVPWLKAKFNADLLNGVKGVK